MSLGCGPRRRGVAPKFLAVLAAVLFVTAAIAGIYSFGLEGQTASSSSSSRSSTSTASSSSSACANAPPANGQRLAPTTFGAITEYTLAPNRTPGGFAVAPDGSTWFGEWGLPGVGHLTANGTLTEYRWPYTSNSPMSICGQQTQIWGVALWNGTVWAADNIYSRLVSVDPSTGQTRSINTTSGVYPYTLSVGAGDLWFTDDLAPGTIGRVTPSSTTPEYFSLPDNNHTSSQFILFHNDTRAYVLTANPVTFTAQVLAFDPSSDKPTFTPVGSSQTLYEPSGIAEGFGGIWATEHGASAMAFLNFTTNRWTIFPTSTVPYVSDVLTYFDGSNGTAVWFNEHYANRMGVLTDNGRSLTEYSITDPPLFNISTILENYNMVTMGLAKDGAWFAATTAGIVGFVNGSYAPPFRISANASSVRLSPGGAVPLGVQITGNVSGANLSLQFQDNEFSNSTAKLLTFVPGPSSPSGNGATSFTATISASGLLQAGTYVAAVTVTNGSIYRTVYLAVEVS